ncbi:MAG: hypothetical protein E6049_09340 [Varibaculum cambriense]|nr:hypothetical protein [Varibaculum cambriense]
MSESIFSDSSPPPTILGMGNNDFENKHPRATDGKFTEKLRKEANVALELEQEPFTPPDTPRGCERGEVFVGRTNRRKKRDTSFTLGPVTEYECPRHDEITGGDWHLMEEQRYSFGGGELIYRTSNGHVHEKYDEKWNLIRQEFMDKDAEPAQGGDGWTEKHWRDNGSMSSRTRFVFLDSNEALENFKVDVVARGGKLTIEEYFDEQGRQTGGRYYRVAGDKLYELKESYSPDGDYRYLESIGFNGGYCAPENEPCFVFYQDGKLSSAKYKVERNGDYVPHRTNGPAIIDNHKPEGERERYFLEGEEYTKYEWEKKVGK